MRKRLSDALVQLVVAVVATLLAALLLNALASLSTVQLVLLGLTALCVLEAIIIVVQRRSGSKGSAVKSEAEPSSRSGRPEDDGSGPSPYGETRWSGGWKTIDYALGDIKYADVLWVPKVPERQGHFAKRVAVDQPPRCPSCRTGLLEETGANGEYIWRCPTGDFDYKSKQSMRSASIGAEHIAQRSWELYKEEQAKRQN